MRQSDRPGMASESTLTIFMLVKTQPVWLGFPVDQRFAKVDKYLKPLLQKYAGEVRLRMFDTEFYSAGVTDVWVWETTSRHAYELVVEGLRETPFWDSYFNIVELFAGVENAAAHNYQRDPLTA